MSNMKIVNKGASVGADPMELEAGDAGKVSMRSAVERK